MIVRPSPYLRSLQVNTSHGLTSRMARMCYSSPSICSTTSKTREVKIAVLYRQETSLNQSSTLGRETLTRTRRLLTRSTRVESLMCPSNQVRWTRRNGVNTSPRQSSSASLHSLPTSCSARLASMHMRKTWFTEAMIQEWMSLITSG